MGVFATGQAPEQMRRVQKMVAAMDEAGFGNCNNTEACEAHSVLRASL